MVKEGLDYTDKATWCDENNLFQIAEDLGYVVTGRFINFLDYFVINTVDQTRIADFLLIIAQHYFEQVSPPLERINGRH